MCVYIYIYIHTYIYIYIYICVEREREREITLYYINKMRHVSSACVRAARAYPHSHLIGPRAGRS